MLPRNLLHATSALIACYLGTYCMLPRHLLHATSALIACYLGTYCMLPRHLLHATSALIACYLGTYCMLPRHLLSNKIKCYSTCVYSMQSNRKNYSNTNFQHTLSIYTCICIYIYTHTQYIYIYILYSYYYVQKKIFRALGSSTFPPNVFDHK